LFMIGLVISCLFIIRCKSESSYCVMCI